MRWDCPICQECTSWANQGLNHGRCENCDNEGLCENCSTHCFQCGIVCLACYGSDTERANVTTREGSCLTCAYMPCPWFEWMCELDSDAQNDAKFEREVDEANADIFR